MNPKKYIKHRLKHNYQFNSSMSILLSKIKKKDIEILNKLKEVPDRVPVTTVDCILTELGIEDKCKYSSQDSKE